MEDLLYSLLGIYRKLPLPAQNSIGTFYRFLPSCLRFGPFYNEYRERIQSFLQSPDVGYSQKLQLDLIKTSVNRAVDCIPFYREYPKIKLFEDLQHFPVINKTHIVNNPDNFIAKNGDGKCLKANTGGSSGTPMEFCLHSGRTRPKESAHFDWFWGQYGFTHGERVLMIRGAPLKNNALYEFQAIKNCFAVSCYELNSSNVKDVLERIFEFRPEFIHGYPSAIKNFIHYINEDPSIEWDSQIKALFLGSEWCSREDKAIVESFFKARVATWYGHSECSAMGGNSIDSDEYFFYPFYGYTELLDENDMPVQTPGQIGRIVSTSFDNFVMPFIRYDTGDWGVLSETETYLGIPCLVLKSIEGRMQDFIYLRDKTKVSLTAFIFGQHLPQFSKIREMQLEQSEIGFLTMRISRGQKFYKKDEQDILKLLKSSVSGKLEIDIEYVDRIEKTHRGKHRFLIQKIDNDNVQK